MNWNLIEGQWHQLTGKIKAKWGKFSEDDLKTIAGKREELLGKLQVHYGLLKEDAEKQIDAWAETLKHDSSKTVV